MELKQRLLSEPEALGNPSTVFPGWKAGIALSGVAAALVLAFLAGPILSPYRNLPPLPPLASTGRETEGASAGPGFTVTLDYSLTGDLGSLPEQAPVYRYAPPPFGPEAAQAVAAKLGITGAVQTEPWQDTIIYSVGSAEDRTLMSFPDGYYNYYRANPDQTDGENLPAAAELDAAAQAFIGRLGITPAQLQRQRVDYPESDAVPATARLFYVPREPGNQVSISPYIMVTVGADKEIYGMSWVWPEAAPENAAYPLREAAAAWAEVQAGKGRLVIDYREIPGPAEGTQIKGVGRVEAMQVGYVLTYATDGAMVLQPVAAFAGTAALENGMQLPFIVYTGAIADRYYQ